MTKGVVTQFSALPGGYRNNNGNFNNVANNGNWWSATENNASNAWNRNLNHNNENLNRNNNNKRLGLSVRLLRDLGWNAVRCAGVRSCTAFFTFQEQCRLAMLDENQKETFVTDLFSAYFCARKNKRNTLNALAFEKHLESNLFSLAEEILGGEYTVSPSICFIVDRPVKREIFAADFLDRVVHHDLHCIGVWG